MTPEINARLAALNAAYRFRIFGPTFYEHEQSGKIRQQDTGHIECDIFDKTVGAGYATERGTTEKDALERALATAEKSEKPMTPAQKADHAARRAIVDKANIALSAAQAENDALRARIAALEGRPSPQPSPATPIADTMPVSPPQPTPPPSPRRRVMADTNPSS